MVLGQAGTDAFHSEKEIQCYYLCVCIQVCAGVSVYMDTEDIMP